MRRPIPPLELAFLWLDRPQTPSNVGVLMLFEPPRGQDASRAVREALKVYRAARPVAPFDSVPVFPVLGLPIGVRPGATVLRCMCFTTAARRSVAGSVARVRRAIARAAARPQPGPCSRST